MNVLEDLIVKLNRKISDLRSISRILESDRFTDTFDSASIEERKKLTEYIESNDRASLNLYVKKRLENSNVRDLRKLAQKMGIRNYTRLPKECLLSEINACQKNIS